MFLAWWHLVGFIWDLYVICSQFQFEITNVEPELWVIFFTIHSPHPGDTETASHLYRRNQSRFQSSIIISPVEQNLTKPLQGWAWAQPRTSLGLDALIALPGLCWWVVSDNAVISLNNALRHLDFTRQRVRLNQSLSFTLPAQHSRQDTCSCIGKSPPSTRSPGIWTIFLLTSACTRSCLDRLITARTSGR